MDPNFFQHVTANTHIIFFAQPLDQTFKIPGIKRVSYTVKVVYTSLFWHVSTTY